MARIKKRLSETRLKIAAGRFIIPNMVTVLAICTGLSSIRFALLEKWEEAVFAILIACVLDSMDGRIARLLKASSHFGAELDSLADFVNFGVSPALVLYLYTLKELKGWGWCVVLFFSICQALRLARFNTLNLATQTTVEPLPQTSFFVGVPAPAGAALALMPLYLAFEVGEMPFSPYITALFVLIIGSLMISRLPTFSFKKMRLNQKFIIPTLLTGALTVGALINTPWLTLTSLGILYLSLIPLSFRLHKKDLKEDALQQEA